MMHTRFTVEESDPKGVLTILRQRFLEALDASVCESQKDIVLVLDKPGLRMINQLILNKAELKKCGVAVIQSIHSAKRHAWFSG